MKGIYLDTNIILNVFLDRNVIYNRNLKKILRNAEVGKCSVTITHEVILEVYYVLTSYYGIDKKTTCDQIVNFIKEDFITVPSKNLVLEALDLSQVLNLSPLDCLIYLKAKEDKAEVLTKDLGFKKLDKYFS